MQSGTGGGGVQETNYSGNERMNPSAQSEGAAPEPACEPRSCYLSTFCSRRGRQNRSCNSRSGPTCQHNPRQELWKQRLQLPGQLLSLGEVLAEGGGVCGLWEATCRAGVDEAQKGPGVVESLLILHRGLHCRGKPAEIVINTNREASDTSRTCQGRSIVTCKF